MMMDATFQPPMELILKAAEEYKKVGCKRLSATFDLFPYSQWRLSLVCGTHSGAAPDDNGYGIGYKGACGKNCKLRVEDCSVGKVTVLK